MTHFATQTIEKDNFISSDIQMDDVDNNKCSIFIIAITSFFMVFGNGMSTLYLIYTNDAINNKKHLNNDIDLDQLEDSVSFYYFTITVSLISILISHKYGYYNILKIYLPFVPAYYIYICLFNILFINYYTIHNEDPCKSRNFFNCTNIDINTINNSSIMYSINVLIIFEIISILSMIMMSYYVEREKYKNLIMFNFIYGFIMTILPVVIMCIVTCGSACASCDDCKPESIDQQRHSQTHDVKKTVKTVINTQQPNKKEKPKPDSIII